MATREGLLELLKQRRTRQQNTASSNGTAGDRRAALLELLKKKRGTGVTAATEAADERTWFQKGAFADGYHVGDLSLSLLGTAGDTALNVVKGAGSMVEGVTDLLLYGASGLSDLVGADSFADDLKDLAKKSSVNDLLSGAEGITDKYSFFGDKMDSVSQGLGQVGTIILTGGVAGAAGLGAGATTAITTGAMGLSSMGSGMSEAYQANASDEDAFVYGLSKGVIDAGSELIFGGLGKVVNAVGISKGLSSLDDIFAKKLASKLSSQTAKNLVEFGVKASAEGFEEVLAGVGTAAAKHFTYMSDEELSKLLKDEKLLDQFVIGAVTSGISQSGIVPGMKSGSLAEANKTGHDFVTGLTKNEQTVVDKVYADEVAKAEKKGKLSAKEKNKIYDDVLNDLEKGYIKTETIEEVLGGSERSRYDALAKEAKEFETLNSMESGKLTGKQVDRLAELKDKNRAASYENAMKEAREKISRGVSEMVRSDRLAESYAERGRKGQAFQADVSQYDEGQRATVQAAIDSGILNNTRRAHEFVDLVAKISADKGVAFNFADNKKLQETGFALEGVTVNGFVNSNGVTVNVNSAKALNSVVGHEIAHVLEGTELYDGLQTAITQYAESKGDYKTRLAQLTKLYEGKEGYTGEDAAAKIEREVVADLVGDYLFTDKEFVSRLSTENRNVFEKIFDEVKYLCRIATAGSKEARQLEKVKKAFEEAYRAEGTKNPTGDGGVRHSLNVEYADGTVKELADLRDLTDEQTISFLNEAKARALLDETYIPVRKELPQVIIDSLAQEDVHLENRSLVMEVGKARRLMRKDINPGNGKRGHGLTPRQIVDIINDIDNPIKIIYQTNRTDQNGRALPNNVAIFVKYSKNGVNGFATVEFENPERTEVIGLEFGETNFYTANTAFFPDTKRNGKPFNYMEYLENDPDNIVLEIKRRQPEDSANGSIRPSTANKLPYNTSIRNPGENVNNKNSQAEITDAQNEKGLDAQQEAIFSLSNDTAYMDKAISANNSALRVDPSIMTEAKAARERVAARMNAIKDKGLVGLPEDIEGNTYIANSSYDGTEENTTICPRSLASEAFVDAVSEYLGRPLTIEEQIYISQDLQGRSMTPECTYCYVATDRKAYRAFLGEYIKQRDAVLQKLKADPDADVTRSGALYKEFLNGRKDTEPMYKRFKMWVDAYRKGTPMVDASRLANISKLMGDINSEFGEALRPQIVDAMKYAQSASWAKKRVNYVAYNGHILKWKQDRINKLNGHYGLRMYSFSDFHPAFVLENMQMITDAAVRGLKMLGYTKDTDFVEIFAPTGMNINVSTFGFSSGGNVYENNIIGAEWEKAKALREKHPNVGVTFVATNDTLVEWALAQDWIDVVIPYHLVRTGAEVAKAFDYTNYTSESADTKDTGWAKGKDKKYIAPTEHNNDKATYLAALEKNHLKPRFERFLDNPNYMKLVNECRQSASESKPVQPVFDENAAMRALAKLEANGYYQPIGGSVDRMYEIAAEVAEDMRKEIAPVMSLSDQEQTDDPFPLPWTIKGEDVGLQEFPLPEGYIQEQEQAAESRTADPEQLAPVPEDVAVKTTREKLAVKKQSLETELAENRRHREESAARLDEKIAKLQAEYDGKKNKDTKYANNLLRRIENLKRRKASIDVDYAKRIGDLEAYMERIDKDLQVEHVQLDEVAVGGRCFYMERPYGQQPQNMLEFVHL